MEWTMGGPWMVVCMAIAVGVVTVLLYFAYRYGRLVERSEGKRP